LYGRQLNCHPTGLAHQGNVYRTIKVLYHHNVPVGLFQPEAISLAPLDVVGQAGEYAQQKGAEGKEQGRQDDPDDLQPGHPGDVAGGS
jgi:hypothetical protein